MLTDHGPALAARLPATHLALGGGAGLAHLIIRLFIWHEIFRVGRYLWRIHTFGPFLVVALGLLLVGLIVWRQSRGSRRPGIWRGRSGGGGCAGSSAGPRDW